MKLGGEGVVCEFWCGGVGWGMEWNLLGYGVAVADGAFVPIIYVGCLSQLEF